MTNRRGFLGAMLAAAAAPAFVQPGSLMRIFVPDQRLILVGDGFTDDTAALQALLSGKQVFDANGAPIMPLRLPQGDYMLSSTITLSSDAHLDGSVIRAAPGLEGPLVYALEGAERVFITNMHFISARTRL